MTYEAHIIASNDLCGIFIPTHMPRILIDRQGRADAVLHKVDNERLAIEVTVFVHVHLHLGVVVIVLHEHATLGKAGSNLLGRGIKREVHDEYCRVLWYLWSGSDCITVFLWGQLGFSSGSRVRCVVDRFALSYVLGGVWLVSSGDQGRCVTLY